MDETESLGAFLRRGQRESRKISLKDVAKYTRIREHFLRAIEEDRLELLPSPTFVKGFLNAFARYLGLDPREILLRYQTLSSQTPVVVPEPPVEERSSTWGKHHWHLGGLLLGGAIAIALIVFYFFFLVPPNVPRDATMVKPESRQDPSPPSLPSPSGETPLDEGKPLSLQLQAVERTWLLIQTKEQGEKEVMLQPGESMAYRARDRIELLVGNAGGLHVTLNGKELEPFGKSGEVVSLTLTSQGIDVKRYEKSESQQEKPVLTTP